MPYDDAEDLLNEEKTVSPKLRGTKTNRSIAENEPEDKSKKAVNKRKLIQETKDERRLLAHQRYLELWDKYEGMVADHFAAKGKFDKASKKIAEF